MIVLSMELIFYHIDKQQYDVILLVGRAKRLNDNHLYYPKHYHQNDRLLIAELNVMLDLNVHEGEIHQNENKNNFIDLPIVKRQ